MYGTELVLDLIVTKVGIPKIVEFQKSGSFYGYHKAYGKNLNFSTWMDWTSKKISSAEPPVLFAGISSNKALTSSFLQHECGQHVPRQKTFAYCPERNIQADVKASFPEDQTLVVKVPDSSNGHGVFFLDQPDFEFRGPLSRNARRHMSGFLGRDKGLGAILTGGWRKPTPRNGHVVIQECLSPREISLGRDTYAPTIRAAMTLAWRDPQHRLQPDILIHGAYYKLPSKTVEHGKSFAPEQLKSNVHSGVGAAKIEPQDMELVSDTIPGTIRRVFRFCAEHSPRELVMKTLADGEPGDMVSAIVYAGMLRNEDATLKEMITFLADSRESLSARSPSLYANLLKDVSKAPRLRAPAGKFENFAFRKPETEPGEIISGIISRSYYRQEIS